MLTHLKILVCRGRWGQQCNYSIPDTQWGLPCASQGSERHGTFRRGCILLLVLCLSGPSCFFLTQGISRERGSGNSYIFSFCTVTRDVRHPPISRCPHSLSSLLYSNSFLPNLGLLLNSSGGCPQLPLTQGSVVQGKIVRKERVTVLAGLWEPGHRNHHTLRRQDRPMRSSFGSRQH